MTIIDDRALLFGLVQAYALSADRRDVPAFAACFVEDATLATIDGSGNLMHRFRGLEEIAVIPTSLGKYLRTMHHVTTHWAEITGLIARGVTYCTAHHITVTDGQAADHVMEIRYEDRYERSADGWKIHDREVHIQWSSDVPVVLSDHPDPVL